MIGSLVSAIISKVSSLGKICEFFVGVKAKGLLEQINNL